MHVVRGYMDTILPKDGPGILYWHVDGKTRLSPGQWTRDAHEPLPGVILVVQASAVKQINLGS